MYRDHESSLPPLDRATSDTTIFSLASPRNSRRRGLSSRFEEDESYSARPEAKEGTPRNRPRAATFTPMPDLSESRRYLSSNEKGGNLDMSPVSRGRALSEPHETAGRVQGTSSGSSQPYLPRPHLAHPKFVDSDQLSDQRSDTASLLSEPNIGAVDASAPEASSSAHSAAPITTALGLESEEMRSPDGDDVLLVPWRDEKRQGLDEHEQLEPWKRRSTRNPIAKVSRGPLVPSDVTFQKRNMVTVRKEFSDRKTVSALSALLTQQNEGPSNPFAQWYKGVAGSNVASGGSVSVEVFFPFAAAEGNRSTQGRRTGKTRSGALSLDAKSRSMQLSVRKDATMEELIGFSLYCYFEEDWRPHLEEKIAPNASEEQRDIRLSTVGWTMRLVEDGEVDDDYPALDRSLAVGKFGADELAVCEATPAQSELRFLHPLTNRAMTDTMSCNDTP